MHACMAVVAAWLAAVFPPAAYMARGGPSSATLGRFHRGLVRTALAGWRGWAGGGWQAPGEGQRMSRRKPPGWGAFSAPFGSTLYSPACNLLVIYIPPTHHTPCSPGHPSCVHINTPTPTSGQHHGATRSRQANMANSFCSASRPHGCPLTSLALLGQRHTMFNNHVLC